MLHRMCFNPSLLRSAVTRTALGLTAGVLLALSSTAVMAQKRPHVVMVVDNAKGKVGTITIELRSDLAPKTVAHFVDLINKKFYDGILFHRYALRPDESGKMVPFVSQAGDPKSKKVKGEELRNITPEEVNTKYNLGDGGSGKTVPLEAKGSHERGTLGLARSQAPDSGDSQFFFNLSPNLQLDSGYCVFGKIVKGLDVMDKIRQGDRIKTLRVEGATTKPSTKPKKK